MPKTMLDCATRALKRIAVVDGAEKIGAMEGADSVAALNAMLHGFVADGMTLKDAAGNDYTHSDLSGSAAFPLHEKHFEGLASLLALRMLDDFGVPPPPALARDVKTAQDRIYADFVPRLVATVDTTLLRLPTNNRWDGVL